jgi:hypothetical protein
VPGIACDDTAIQVGVWQLPDRIMLLVHNTDTAQEKSPTLKINLEKLNLVPARRWQDFVRAQPLYAPKLAAADDGKKPKTEQARAKQIAETGGLLFREGKLLLDTIPPGRGRIVGIRKY